MKFVFDVNYLNDKKANADMEITINIPHGILAVIAWADEKGNDLPEYLPLKSLPLIDGKGSYRNTNSLMIPEKAKTLRCHIYNDDMLEIVLPELTKEIPAEKLLEEKQPLTKFIATSDIHVGGNYFNNVSNRLSAFDYIRNAKPEFVLICGDITDNSNVNEFEEAAKLIDSLENIPVFACTGNHDLSPYMQGCYAHHEEMRAFFNHLIERNRKLGAKVSDLSEKRYYYSGEVNGKQILVIDANEEKNNFFVGEEQTEWLESVLSESDGARYRFMISHFHQKDTVLPLEHRIGKNYYADNDVIQEMMNRHKNIIHVSGHTHYNFDHDLHNTCFDSENKLLYINAGCAVWNGVGMNERVEYYIKNRCTGQIIEVYDDYMITRAVDFVSGKFIPRCLHYSKF